MSFKTSKMAHNYDAIVPVEESVRKYMGTYRITDADIWMEK